MLKITTTVKFYSLYGSSKPSTHMLPLRHFTKKNSFYLLSIIALLFLHIDSIQAQQLENKLDLHSFSDNREYIPSGHYSQTIFGNRFAPAMGLLLDSVHRMRIGFNGLYEFGSLKKVVTVDPLLYYQFEKENWNFFMGIFSRYHLLTDYPRVLLTDTLAYYRPHIEGMLLKYANEQMHEIVWIDWTSRQTATDREAFLFGLSGNYKNNWLFLSHHAYMLHRAGTGIPIPGDHVEDNGAATVKLGLDLSKKTILDSLTLNLGVVMSFERVRSVTDFKTPVGALVEFHARYAQFGINNSYYRGEGHHLIYGDPFYTASGYNRTDFTWQPRVHKNMSCQLALSFHFVNDVMDTQQAFNLRYHFGVKKKIKLSEF